MNNLILKTGHCSESAYWEQLNPSYPPSQYILTHNFTVEADVSYFTSGKVVPLSLNWNLSQRVVEYIYYYTSLHLHALFLARVSHFSHCWSLACVGEHDHTMEWVNCFIHQPAAMRYPWLSVQQLACNIHFRGWFETLVYLHWKSVEHYTGFKYPMWYFDLYMIT